MRIDMNTTHEALYRSSIILKRFQAISFFFVLKVKLQVRGMQRNTKMNNEHLNIDNTTNSYLFLCRLCNQRQPKCLPLEVRFLAPPPVKSHKLTQWQTRHLPQKLP